MDINTIITIVSALVAIGVSWGITTTKIEGLAKEVETMKDSIRECPTKESCNLKHDYIDRSLGEIKADIKEIKEILKEMGRRPK